MFAYLKATRHPWTCFLFVVPLLVAYEVGVVMLANGADATGLRNGADIWLRGTLVDHGIQFPWALPALVAAVLLVRTWWAWADRPASPLSGVVGTAVESVAFAVGLWLVARNFRPLLEAVGVPVLDALPERLHAIPSGQLVRFVGAGIYEEVLFRMGLFSLLCVLFKFSLLPNLITVPLAAAAGAVLFAAAHHVGPHGEEIVPVVFAFRVVAGLIFTALYQFRGFGVAVGTHAGYDILVGVSVG
jgi:hypothetical protein